MLSSLGRLAAASVSVLVVSAVGVGAADRPIPGKVGIVKPANLAKLVSKPAAPVGLPVPASPADPTVGGAELAIFDTELFGAGTVSFVLDASGWKGLGNPAGSTGYKYKGGDDVNGGPCATVLLKPTVIKAVCKGTTVTLTPPFAGTVAVALGLPAGTAATERYCAELGGTEKKNDPTQTKRTNAPAPAACPEPPSSLDPGDVAALADDAMMGRNNNTPGSLLAQAYLIDALQEMGAVGLNGAQSGDDAYKQPFTQNGTIGTNILAVIPGSELPDEYVVVGAHYDHLTSCRTIDPGDTICNGATDNAAGAAAVLAVGRGVAALPVKPRRSVVLALWDAEEDSLRGSLYYTNNPLVPIADTVGYLNFDIQGANLLPSVRHLTFAVGAETGVGLPALVGQAASGGALSTRNLSYIFGQGRSDYVNFVAVGVPTVFFSDSTGPCYHSNADELAVVDLAKLEDQARNGYELTLSLANAVAPPLFLAPSSSFATFQDCLVINDILTAGLADLGLFAPADQLELQQIQATIAQIAADGEASFDSSDVITLLFSTIEVIDLLTRTACDGFL